MSGAILTALLAPVTASARPALVFEPKTGIVVYAEEPDRLWHPASVTKLMTAYLAFKAVKEGKLTLEDKVVQSENSIKEPPSKVGLPVGSEITLDRAIRVLMVKSANDVAVMIAERVGGSVQKFAAMMNKTARELGMSNSFFVNPNGLPDPGLKQVVTARDLAILTRAIIRDFPDRAEYFKIHHLKWGRRRFRNYNSLLHKYDGTDGMKTGFICASGYNVVVSATRNGVRLVAVVLGSRSGGSRHNRAVNLLNYGFEYLKWKKALFRTTLAKLPDNGEEARPAPNLRSSICNRRRVYRKRRYRKRRAVRSRRKVTRRKATRRSTRGRRKKR